MLFDWFTVGAQALNFLILVWLMKRFLYKPILDAIDAREKRIASALADAALKQATAQKEQGEFQAKNAAFDRQHSEMLAKVKDEIATERQRLLEDARQAADALSVKRQDALASELQSLHQDIARRSRDEVFAVAHKVLADLAGTTLEARMAEVFVRRLRTLDEEARARLARALQASPSPVRVRSVFELPPAQRAALQQALNETLAADTQVCFETTPALISGIELTANGWKLDWNIAEVLASLEQHVDGLLEKPSEPQRQPEPAAATAAETTA
ncbi:F0F1 ATP synthase subunit delta [Polaromonas naphthalenivorans]|uniref:ATP synthase subunit b n=1 Tax=Polaromonas naphthalenivorans (strain CJ2) TaxID=365044 RepID=A1VPQ9_POLNA|nr:F0F1 ATP synthase subunit delta [Polaromonas naphthalenivorans]ABM37637.1 ATP synthase F0 subcomplex B subunit [Polaromonas naphthalenivorans CJ2]